MLEQAITDLLKINLKSTESFRKKMKSKEIEDAKNKQIMVILELKKIQ